MAKKRKYFAVYDDGFRCNIIYEDKQEVLDHIKEYVLEVIQLGDKPVDIKFEVVEMTEKQFHKLPDADY
jgi:hypothetical protein